MRNRIICLILLFVLFNPNIAESQLDSTKVGIIENQKLTYDIYFSNEPFEENYKTPNYTDSFTIGSIDLSNNVVSLEDFSKNQVITETIYLNQLIGLMVYTDWDFWESTINQHNQPFILPNIVNQNKLFWSSGYDFSIDELWFNFTIAEVIISDAVGGNVAVEVIRTFKLDFSISTGVAHRFMIVTEDNITDDFKFVEFQLVEHNLQTAQEVPLDLVSVVVFVLIIPVGRKIKTLII